MSKNKPLGLKERIQRANSDAEIKTLLEEGGSYTQASSDTQRGWRRAAEKRNKELNNTRHG